MTDDEAAEANEQLARLRALVGPSEVAYESLLVDREAAQNVAKQALAESGELRGRIEEMRVQLARARQDQDVLLLRAELVPWRQVVDRLHRRWMTSVAPRASRLTDRVRST